MTKIAAVTSARADYGLLAPLLHKIRGSDCLQLQMLVTGAHLMDEFGLTVRGILDDGFAIDRTIPEISSAPDGIEVARQVGSGLVAFTTALEELAPDALVVLGDRYEILPAAIAAFFLDIPIVHLHGGEVTHGAFDDATRHSISQLARVHAVAAPEYARRLIQAGAHPDSVHVVGGLGVDALQRTDLLNRRELEAELAIKLCEPLILATYHPVTAGERDTHDEIQSLISALRHFSEATVVWTLPNVDPEHRTIIDSLTEAVKHEKDWHLFSSLGSAKYLSLMAEAEVVVGNSSSGLLEAPTLTVPAVNIGSRQDGRIKAQSVISCGTTQHDIERAISHALSTEFVESLDGMVSPFGTGGAADQILELLETIRFDGLGPKKYYDWPDKR